MEKKVARISVVPSGQTFDCPVDETIMRAAVRAGIGFPYSCNVGSCGNCRFELIEGDVRHLRADAPAWSERDLKRNRWLGCQAAPIGDCTIKFRADDKFGSGPAPLCRKGRLVGTQDITRDIRAFDFEVDQAPDFIAGQYALLSTAGIEGGRPYSFSNLPASNIWTFMIKKVPGGKLTAFLFDDIKPGDEIDLDGPWGIATFDPTAPRDVVLIAGGSGLSPMVSIAHRFASAPEMKGRKLHFYYGARQSRDLFAPDILPAAPEIHLVNVLSEPDEAWKGQAGFVHKAVEADLGPRLANHEIYFAGPAVMSAEIQRMAHVAGVPMTQLHFDEFY